MINFTKQKKYSFDSLYNRLLSPGNSIFENSESILVQPIIYKNKNLIEDFEEVHGKDILDNCLNLYEYSYNLTLVEERYNIVRFVSGQAGLLYAR